MGVEQVTGADAELLGLAREADALEPPQPGAAPALSPNAQRQQWIDLALRLGAMAREAHPICREHWTEEKLTMLGSALADCAAKYGWTNTAALFTHPLVSLAMASGVLAWPFIAPYIMRWVEGQANNAAELGVPAKTPPEKT